MARRKYIERGDSMERHVDSGVFLVPNPSLNYSGSYGGDDGDLKSREISRLPAGSKVAPLVETYKQLDAAEYNEDQLQDNFLMNIVLPT